MLCVLLPPKAPTPSALRPSIALVLIGSTTDQALQTRILLFADITEASYDSEGYRQIMGVIARRLQDVGEAWRHVYKSLLLLEYMLKHGPQKARIGHSQTPSQAE